MSNISATAVADLRKQTGAGLMDCKKALQESNGDYDGALEYLRKKGQRLLRGSPIGIPPKVVS